MNIEDAIEKIKQNYPNKIISESYIEMTSALSLAIESLEKRIPKKPIITEFINDEIAIYECRCGIAPQFRYKQHKYCPECGQKLDWGE